jgi:hypothetical protein
VYDSNACTSWSSPNSAKTELLECYTVLYSLASYKSGHQLWLSIFRCSTPSTGQSSLDLQYKLHHHNGNFDRDSTFSLKAPTSHSLWPSLPRCASQCPSRSACRRNTHHRHFRHLWRSRCSQSSSSADQARCREHGIFLHQESRHFKGSHGRGTERVEDILRPAPGEEAASLQRARQVLQWLFSQWKRHGESDRRT